MRLFHALGVEHANVSRLPFHSHSTWHAQCSYMGLCPQDLPEEMEHLQHLRQFDISCNRLKNVPKAIQKMTAMQVCSVLMPSVDDFASRRSHIHMQTPMLR